MRPGERLLRLGIWGRRQAQRPSLSNTAAYGYIDSVVVGDDTATISGSHSKLIHAIVGKKTGTDAGAGTLRRCSGAD